MTTSIADVKINEKGECNFCELHDSLEKSSKGFDWDKRLNKIRKAKKKYDCLIGISGGLDSSILLDYAVNVWKLNPLVIHFDNRWNCEEANYNIDMLVKRLNVDFIRYYLNQAEYDDLCLSFLLASVSDADIPNDMAMGEMMLRTCKQYKIKYIFNGHNFRTEGTSPLSWSYMDAKYIESVYAKFNQGKKLLSFPLLTFWKQLYYTVICGIKQERPFYYLDINEQEEKDRLIRDYGWRDYGSKHAENIYTEFVGSYYLPVKYGIDKRIIYHSALIRSGRMVKIDKAFNKLPEFNEEKLNAICKRLKITREYFDQVIMPMQWSTFEDFKTYHRMFKRYRPVFYVLTRLHLLPNTFYIKYCT